MMIGMMMKEKINMSTFLKHAVQCALWLLLVVSMRTSAQPLPSLAPMLESVTPAVVNISTVTRVRANNPYMNDPFFRRFFENERRGSGDSQSLGSGVIVDAERGIVVTNDHVIAGADTILVTLADGREFDARLLGTDPDTDVAVLEIEASGLSALEWADSDALRVGDYCVAIGNPFGLGQTVTSGIVSALGRSGLGIQEFEDFIQTDASINPGNSGGALVALDGRLIGINTAIVAPGGGNVGIGFAIPANLARDLVEQIIETGRVQRGELGIAAQALTPQLAEAFDVDLNAGVIVRRVNPDSPAEKAGLQVGDVIVAVDGRPVADVGDVRNRIGLVRLGQRLQVQLMRDGELQELNAIVEEVQLANVLLGGASLIDARARDGRRFVALESVDADSALGRAGVRAGDVILSVNRTPVASVDQMEQLAQRTPDALLLLVQRGRTTRYIQLGG
jgi:serine protease Do/serine protease DegQ